MHCLKCGGQLNPDAKEPLCSYCKSEVAREVISKSPTWALRIALEALSEELDDLKRAIQELKTLEQKS
jgi:predicted amidophosphoribosyltransferase